MTHKERMAALVDAGEKVESITEIEYPAGIHKYHEMARAAFNARPSIALALEIVGEARGAANWLNAVLKRHKQERLEDVDWARMAELSAHLDALLERWEGKE